MNINELRIGNYVYDDENNVVEITRLETKIYTYWNSGNEYSVVFKKLYIEGYFEGDIKPIPLTEKLLVDYLGYEPSAFTGLYYDKEGIIDIKVSWDNKFTVYYKNCEIREVEFLHDLQNLAFALTKEELKINE